MHDLTIAADILETALKVAADHGGGRVRRVHVVLGPKSHLDPTILAEAFEFVTFPTEAHGAELEIDKPPATCRCNACGRSFESATWPVICSCGSVDVFSQDSSEIAITAIDVDETDLASEGETAPS